MYFNPEKKQTFGTHSDIRQSFENTTLPADLTDEILEGLGFYVVNPVTPHFDPIRQSATEMTPAALDGKWYQVWQISDLPADQVAANQAAKLEADEMRVAEKASRLWEAADAYEKQFISGVSVGLLTMGVMLQKPKAQAIAQWSGKHWEEYYKRKSRITADSAIDTDFSTSGQMPYSVPELRQELGM